MDISGWGNDLEKILAAYCDPLAVKTDISVPSALTIILTSGDVLQICLSGRARQCTQIALFDF